ncbi:MAG TPA: hydroxymethylbilane synthase [Acidimicrobiales bacterium]|nr:hydroxymethylbilane synthase [Acidimicrobiales bacterium]
MLTGAPSRLRLATRASPLALWQAHHVAGLLARAHAGLVVQVVGTDTLGDRRLDLPLSEIGGKGVFATEVQRLVLEGVADIAVHSAKDLPAVTAEGLALAAVPARGDARDALVGGTLDDLAPGAVVATGSQRRQVQLAELRPDLRFVGLRGNMATRLARVGTEVDGTVVDAVVVAAVALERLDLDEEIDEVLATDVLLPQVGQGALAVEARAGDTAVADLLAPIQDPASRRRLDAERAFLAELGGDCDLPAGAHAEVLDAEGTLRVRALLADPSGRVHRAGATGIDPDGLGASLARTLRLAAAAR